MIIAPTPIAANSQPAPDASDGSTFSLRATAFADYLYNTAVAGMNAATANAYNNALEAYNNATAAATAAGAAGAIAWVTGTTYAIGDARFSPINFQTYRRKAAGAGTTDPSLDTANWERVVLGDPLLLPRSARTTNTVLGTADKGTLIDITSGTFSQTFTAAVTLGNGWYCYYRNSGTGVITLDPDAAELIDGASTLSMVSGDVRLIVSTGTALVTVPVQGCDRAFGAISSATVLATVNTTFVAACALSATRRLVLRRDASGYPLVSLLSETGALIATSAVFESVTTQSSQQPQIVRINSTDGLAIWVNSSLQVRVAVVRDAGASVTVGGLQTLYTAGGGFLTVAAAFLTAAKIVGVYSDSLAGPILYGRVLGISGTTITPGTQVSYASVATPNYLRCAAVTPGDGGRVAVIYPNTTILNSVIFTESASTLAGSDSRTLLVQPTSVSNCAGGDIVGVRAGRILVVSGGALNNNGGPAVSLTADFSGAGLRANREVEFVLPAQLTPGSESLHRLAQLTDTTCLRLSSSNECLGLSSIQLPDSKPKLIAASDRIGRAQWYDLAVWPGSPVLVAYSDVDNSNYITIKTVALGTVV